MCTRTLSFEMFANGTIMLMSPHFYNSTLKTRSTKNDSLNTFAIDFRNFLYNSCINNYPSSDTIDVAIFISLLLSISSFLRREMISLESPWSMKTWERGGGGQFFNSHRGKRKRARKFLAFARVSEAGVLFREKPRKGKFIPRNFHAAHPAYTRNMQII